MPAGQVWYARRILIGELKTFTEFTPEDAALLRKTRDELTKYFDPIVNRFYETIELHPRAYAVFRDQEQIERQKAFLRGWLDTFFCGKYDDAYCDRRRRIGRVHVQVGLPQRYMFMGMAVIRIELHAAVLAQDWSATRKQNVIFAIDKLCDIELAIMVEAYCEGKAQIVLEGERKAADHAVSAMARLTAGLAHEVRNPLNAAKLQIELLRRSANRMPEQERDGMASRLRIVNNEIDRLSVLLDEFLSLTKPGTEFVLNTIDIVKLIDEIVELEKPVAAQAGIRLISTCGDVPLIVRADARRMRQVLLNLIKNAMEALGNTKKPVIEIAGLRCDSQTVRVSVTDNGTGVDEDVLQQALLPFFTTKEGGTGLGLSVVQRIVVAHGSSLRLENVEGGGLRASFALQREHPSEPPPPNAPSDQDHNTDG